MARITGGTVARGTKRRSGGNGRGRKSKKKKLDSPNTLIVLGSGWKDRSWAMPLAGATDYSSSFHTWAAGERWCRHRFNSTNPPRQEWA